MINAHDDDLIGKEATLERLKAEVAHLAKSFAGITSLDDELPSSQNPGKHGAGYFMHANEDSIEPST